MVLNHEFQCTALEHVTNLARDEKRSDGESQPILFISQVGLHFGAKHDDVRLSGLRRAFFYHFILFLEGYIAAAFIASASDCASLTYIAAECIFFSCTKLALHLYGSFLALCDCAHGKLGLG